MNRKKPFSWVIPFITFSMMHFMLSAQAPAVLDSKMKPSISNDMRIEELKVRWKKAALENCPGIPCVTTPPAPLFTCGTSKVTDIDGNQYNTVLIGAQCWLKENLKVGKYNDGTDIHLDATGGSAGNGVGESWSGLSSGAKTVYAHNSTYLNDLGYLYNWYAAVDNRGICQDGWKVPSKLEWQSLETFLSSTPGDVGLKMMVTTSPFSWSTTFKTNSSEFTALSAGYRNGVNLPATGSGHFRFAGVSGAGVNRYSRWWSTDSVSPTSIDDAVLEDQNANGFSIDTSAPDRGNSIRCIKK